MGAEAESEDVLYAPDPSVDPGRPEVPLGVLQRLGRGWGFDLFRFGNVHIAPKGELDLPAPL